MPRPLAPPLSEFSFVLIAIFAVCDFSFAQDDQPVQVYILAGQSNMEGKGNPDHLTTYQKDPTIAPTYASLRTGDQWRVRDDVWITYPSKNRGAKHGPLTVGYGTKGENSIGPEFGFGHAIGNATQAPVLLIKIAWGGKSLGVDFRPPNSPPTDEEIERMLQRVRKKKPDTTVEEVRSKYGHYYRQMLVHIQTELKEVGDRFPELKDRKFNLAGFVWHQGFNDKVNRDLRENQYADYTKWLIQFIKDVRHDLKTPSLPFVIGELSTGGIPARGDFQKAQAAAAAPTEFQGNVSFVPTAEYYDVQAHELYKKNFWKGTQAQKAQWQKVGNDRPYHYLGSGKTYYLKGVAFAQSILKLQE